jgi:murein DD-endopeptidase MepM/ murein hydrolase activator NlpD
MKNKKQGLNKEKLFSAIISFAIILTLGYGIYSVVSNTNSAKKENNIVNLNDQDNDVAIRTEDGKDLPGDVNIDNKDGQYESDAEAANANASREKANAQEETSKQAIADVAANVDPAANYSFSDADTMMWPVNGEVLLKYSMDTTIFFKTLGSYKTNPAVYIAADVGTNVGVAADGVVLSVSWNEETGNTVVVGIGSGYQTTYGMLDNVNVKKGDKVVEGQLLGTVAQPTGYYCNDGTGVYFKVTQNEEPVDPVQFFGE